MREADEKWGESEADSNTMKDTSKRFLNVHLSISPIASGDNKGGVSRIPYVTVMYHVEQFILYSFLSICPWFTLHNSPNEGYFGSQCLWGVTRQGLLSKRIVFLLSGKTLDTWREGTTGLWKTQILGGPHLVPLFSSVANFPSTLLIIMHFEKEYGSILVHLKQTNFKIKTI